MGDLQQQAEAREDDGAPLRRRPLRGEVAKLVFTPHGSPSERGPRPPRVL